jgi:hypothetical protein
VAARLGLGTDDPLVGLVGGHGLLHQPTADQLQGLAFPGLLLAAVLDQLAGPQAEAEGAEAAAGVDRRQLPVIAHQDHLCLGLLGVVEEAGELAGAEHAGLVHHQHRPSVQPLAALVEVGQEPVAGGGLLEPLGLQADGGDAGGGTGQGPVAVQLPGMPGHAQGERLARPGPPDDQRDAGAALADVAHHPGLVLTGGWVGLEGGPDGLMSDHRRLLTGPVGGRGDQLLLDGQQLGGGPAALLQRPVGHHRNRPVGQEAVGQLLELGPGGPGQLAAEGRDHLLAGEGGRGRGQPVRAGQPIEHLDHRPLGQVLVLLADAAGHLPHQGVRVLAALGRLGPPPPIQGVRGLVLLGLAGGMDGPLDQPRRPLPSGGLQALEFQVNLVAALGETPHQLVGHPWELPVAVPVGRRPLHPQRPGELALVGGPVDGVGGQPMPVQVPAVQGRPPTVRALDTVSHHQVGVQQRIALSASAVVEADRQQPLSVHMLVAAMAAPCPQVLVQVGGRLGHASVMGLKDRPAGGRVAQAVEDRDALGGAHDHVEGRDGVAAMGAAEELVGVGVAALKHASEPRRRCFALQPEAGGAGTIPAAWTLAVAGQVRFVVGGQLPEVVILPPHRELGDVRHHPATASSPSLAPANAPVVHCCPPDWNFGEDSMGGGQECGM